MAPGSPWREFSAEQTISVYAPGFIWLAGTTVGSLLPLRILNSYVGGHGRLEARLFGSLPLARAAGPAIDRGELMRYLAELVWAPHAMLLNPHLDWRTLGRESVEVSAAATTPPARVRLLFEAGEIRRIEADDRPRMEGRRTAARPWAGRFFDYRALGDLRIPTRGEVSWILDGNPFACWRGEVTSASLE